MAARRSASGTGTRLAWAAALSVVVGLSACSSAPTEPTPTQAPDDGRRSGAAWDEPAFATIGYGGQLVEVVPSKRLVAVFVTEVLSTTRYEKVDGRAYEKIVSYVVVPRLGS
jgi:hypothetical protein